jgi:hypothetical protein
MCKGSTIGLPYESSRVILRHRADDTPCKILVEEVNPRNLVEEVNPRYGFGQRERVLTMMMNE